MIGKLGCLQTRVPWADVMGLLMCLLYPTNSQHVCNVPVIAEVEVDHNMRETYYSQLILNRNSVWVVFKSPLHNYAADNKM